MTKATKEQLEPHRSGDVVLDHMLRTDAPLDRETYLALNYGAKLPRPWTAEHESDIPEPLQDWSKVKHR